MMLSDAENKTCPLSGDFCLPSTCMFWKATAGGDSGFCVIYDAFEKYVYD